ncbi:MULTISPECIES: hypothetical protein [unclassified Sporolactobacillus]|uniref:hypothetical protein n=1 Tax=unclassified Sporolactobacillus TaxID=2628533 RepID=UPI00236871FE|nr:hypothetical protein [Sporolactobacillus sp. CQH2019]MDD9148522.1 hypothetical protein [Sporolactobacillus sp. CQH2019]
MSAKNVSCFLLIGALLTGITTVLHPVIYNPWNGRTAMQQMARCPIWLWDHAWMIVAVILWIGGLIEFERIIGAESRAALVLFITALSLWVLFLTAELSALPYLMHVFAGHPDFSVQTVIQSLFIFNLLLGYITIMLVWLGIFFLGLFMRQKKYGPSWLGCLGMAGGLIGAAGSLYTTLYPEKGGLSVMIFSSAIPYIWTIVLSVYTLIKRQPS